MNRRYPLTSLQKTMLLASLREPRSGFYVVQDVWEHPADLDPALLKRAWDSVARRHPALRTRFGMDARGEPWQTFPEDSRIEWREADWTPDFLNQDAERGFDFEREVPIRITLAGNRIVWTRHHALLDGRSYAIVWREWLAAYAALRRGEEPDATPSPAWPCFLDWLAGRDPGGAEDYWRTSLAGLEQTVDYVVDRLHEPSEEPFGRHRATATPELTARLQAFARAHEITLNTLLLGAWAILLSRYSGRTGIAFGATRSGRHVPVPDAANLVGMAITTVPFRVNVDPSEFLLPWLRGIRRQWVELREYEHTPLQRIWEWSGVPPFESVVIYEHAAPAENPARFRRTDAPFTLAAYGAPVLTLQLAWDAGRFGARTMSALAGHLLTILSAIPEHAGATLAQLPMLTAAEKHWAIEDRNRTSAPLPDVCAHRLFEEQVRRSPERTALEYRGEAITYAELDRRADQLAHTLRLRGAGPDDLVALVMDRGPELVTGMLGALKAGAAFLPLSPDLPADRLASMLAEAHPKVVLPCGAELCSAAELPLGPLPNTATPANAAYAIYTSGSTGRPKAVVVTHRSLVNHTLAARRAFGITESDRRLQFASVGSDVIVAEVFNYLTCGATLVFGQPRQAMTEFVRTLEAERITITGIPSSWWGEWVSTLEALPPPPTLRAIVTGMERVDPAALATWRRVTQGRLRWFNAYGPTETCLTATIYESGSSVWESPALVPIGKPIANDRVYVLDEQRNPVPVGQPGELYIGGAGVARGYLHSPDLTAQRFLPDPFAEGRMYRTRDCVFSLPDGHLVFLGRLDRQVKIRGFRIELEEIESALASHPGVRQCAVVAAGQAGFTSLVAYLAPIRPPAPSPAELRAHLARRLPEHMLPASYVVLPELPRNASGKIDTRALPSPASAPAAAQESLTPVEQTLAGLWRNVLGSSPARPAENFFEAGGDSLRATRLITLIRDYMGVELPLTALLRAPTLAGMAALLERGEEGGHAVLGLHREGDLPPLFCISPRVDNPLCFVPLARALGPRQPFFALGAHAGTVVQDRARSVLHSIREIRPRGPYRLGGHCFGGLLAFEAARQLLAEGERVDMLLLFDVPAPCYPESLRRLRSLWRRVQRVSIPETNGYCPDPVAVRIVHFLASDAKLGDRLSQLLFDARTAWSPFCRGQLENRFVPGSHATLLTHPSLARSLRDVLED